MATVNRTLLLGRLTTDPEPARQTPKGTATRFRLAVGRGKKNAAGVWENVGDQLYMDCDVFAQTGAKRDLVGVVTTYLKKGDQVFVEGRLKTDEWNDKQSGQKRSKTVMVVENLELMGGGDKAEKGKPADAPRGGGDDYQGYQGGGDGDDDPLPF